MAAYVSDIAEAPVYYNLGILKVAYVSKIWLLYIYIYIYREREREREKEERKVEKSW